MKKEIEITKKPNIIKNTPPFAEISNDENQQPRLIKVNLSEFKNEIPKFYPLLMN